MNEELDRIERQTMLLLNIQFEGMSQADQQRLRDSIEEIHGQYADAAKKRDDASLDKATRDYYGGICESIAGGLPGITKGALSAASAFKSGDYMNGTAAIMDICASAAPIIGSIFAAGGPPGALIGALFSVVGQLLAFFGPKQPSLKDAIKDLMLSLEAEAKLRTMLAVGDSIDVYAAGLTNASEALREILARPLVTERDAERFQADCGALEIGLARDQNRMDTPAFNNWEVMEWLRQKDRQDLEKWPEVLAVFCRSYTKLVRTNVLFTTLPNGNRVFELMEQTRESNTSSPLLPATRHDVHQMLIALQSLSKAFAEGWRTYNNKVLELLGEIETAAQLRGLFFHVGDKGYLYAGSGRSSIVDNNGWTYLKGDPDAVGSGYGYIAKVTATQSAADEAIGAPKPHYHCFLQRNTDGYTRATEHRMVHASTPPNSYAAGIKPTWFNDDDKPKIADIWAVQAGVDDAPKEVWLFLATGKQIGHLQLNAQNKLENRNGWMSPEARAPLTFVRSVYPESVPNDPAGDLLSVFPSLTPRGSTMIHYGGMTSSPEIFVLKNDGSGHVPAPWSQYTGIGVDKNFLWVFGAGGFACATHTSVLRALGERLKGSTTAKPTWIEHYPNQLLYKGLTSAGTGLVGPRANEPALNGLRMLSPCDDGTLTCIAFTRSYDGRGTLQGEEGPRMHTASYEVNVKAGTIRVEEWTKLQGEAQSEVLKLPIYCWPLLRSLKARLVSEGAR